jgi:hypothetical protein
MHVSIHVYVFMFPYITYTRLYLHTSLLYSVMGFVAGYCKAYFVHDCVLNADDLIVYIEFPGGIDALSLLCSLVMYMYIYIYIHINAHMYIYMYIHI